MRRRKKCGSRGAEEARGGRVANERRRGVGNDRKGEEIIWEVSYWAVLMDFISVFFFN